MCLFDYSVNFCLSPFTPVSYGSNSYALIKHSWVFGLYLTDRPHPACKNSISSSQSTWLIFIIWCHHFPWIPNFNLQITYLQLKQNHTWLECNPHLVQLFIATFKMKNGRWSTRKKYLRCFKNFLKIFRLAGLISLPEWSDPQALASPDTVWCLQLLGALAGHWLRRGEYPSLKSPEEITSSKILPQASG